MSVYWNSRTKNLSPYIPGEQPRDRQFIKLNTNENPYPPSPAVIAAIQKAAGERLRLYPDPACTEFREAIAARYGVQPEQVFAANGSDEALAFAFGAFFEPLASGGEILFPDITYSFYPAYAALWGIPFRAVPLGDDFSINTDDYRGESGGVVFPNPNAPTGMALPLGDIIQLAEHLARQKKVFILDEAYAPFGAESAVPRVGEHPNLLIVHTLSKSASLAGLRLGFAIGDAALIEGLCRVRDSFNSYTVDRLALAGGTAAILDAAYYDEINRRVIATRERTAAALRGLGFDVLPSSANFIFTRAPGIDGAAFFAALRQRGILARHFNHERIANYVRVSIGTDTDMDIFLEACQTVIKSGS